VTRSNWISSRNGGLTVVLSSFSSQAAWARLRSVSSLQLLYDAPSSTPTRPFKRYMVPSRPSSTVRRLGSRFPLRSLNFEPPADKGWAAFRDAETIILRKLFAEHPKGVVIACGGGVVEREENRELLKQFRDDGHPIVHVVRDKEETIRYLVDEAAR
jgi:hypothetical protein